jgi:hypothetical protein
VPRVVVRQGEKVLAGPVGFFVATSEWKVIRRQELTNHGRRRRLFSMKFITSQLVERFEYRLAVRLVQQRPELKDRLDFPYTVPAPISIGARVSAVNHMRGLVEEGSLLSYDAKGGYAFIQFEGHQCLCPDTEILLIDESEQDKPADATPEKIKPTEPSSVWTNVETSVGVHNMLQGEPLPQQLDYSQIRILTSNT